VGEDLVLLNIKVGQSFLESMLEAASASFASALDRSLPPHPHPRHGIGPIDLGKALAPQTEAPSTLQAKPVTNSGIAGVPQIKLAFSWGRGDDRGNTRNG
jgi:hypothetical protein